MLILVSIDRQTQPDGQLLNLSTLEERKAKMKWSNCVQSVVQVVTI